MELGFAVDGIKGYYSYFTLSVNRWGSGVSAGVERGALTPVCPVRRTDRRRLQCSCCRWSSSSCVAKRTWLDFVGGGIAAWKSQFLLVFFYYFLLLAYLC